MKNKYNFSLATLLNRPVSSPKTIPALFDQTDDIVELACSNPDPSLLLSPQDFSRKSKLGLLAYVRLLIASHAPTQAAMSREMMGPGFERVSSSAITQTKGKIKSDFFKYLFFQINMVLILCSRQPNRKERRSKHQYQFIAIDGSNLPIPVNFSEPDYIVRKKNSNEPKWAGMHLSFCVDLLTGLFLDCVFQTQRGKDERKAAMIIMEHYHRYYHRDGITPVFIMDRGYFSYPLALFCARHGYKYLIRCKEREFFSLFPDLIEKEGIRDARKQLSIHNRASDRRNPNHKYVSPKTINAIKKGAEEMIYRVRGVSIEISPGVFEYLLTNFTDPDMTVSDYKLLYHARWKIETKIGQIKYGGHLLQIHSKKAEWIKQEVWAGLIAMNLSAAAALLAAPEAAQFKETERRQKKSKHKYQINLTNVIRSVSLYLLGRWGKVIRRISESSLVEEIQREKSCIRENRSFPRKLYPKRLIWFTWR